MDRLDAVRAKSVRGRRRVDTVAIVAGVRRGARRGRAGVGAVVALVIRGMMVADVAGVGRVTPNAPRRVSSGSEMSRAATVSCGSAVSEASRRLRAWRREWARGRRSDGGGRHVARNVRCSWRAAVVHAPGEVRPTPQRRRDRGHARHRPTSPYGMWSRMLCSALLVRLTDIFSRPFP